ncbi:MAG TPA: hypothetical protein VNB90_03800 [Cytophagaceae bacterium]|jgi:hypothetical protein|nr:hypothetical protein [Cytophagaceae bacterium]
MDANTNIQLIKIKFIEEFAALNNETLVKKLYEILIREKQQVYESLLKPMTQQAYLQKAEQSNNDISAGDIIDHQDLKKESENW